MFMFPVSHNVNPIINNIERDEIGKKTWIIFWLKMLKWQNEEGS